MPRIMTYNVHRCVGADRRSDPRRIADMIAACEPDIVALQELDVRRKRTGGIDQAHVIAEALAMKFHFHPAVAVQEELYGDAILTALPMRLVQAGPLPSAISVESRGALWATIQIEGGEVQVINTHLGLAAHERMLQINHLLGPTWLGRRDCNGPAILLGDFNAVRRSRVYRKITRRFRDAQVGLCRRPARTFPSRLPMLRIDHAFCTPDIEVIDARVPRGRLARRASDHLPLVVDFRLKPRK